jgi:hypothetical protein
MLLADTAISQKCLNRPCPVDDGSRRKCWRSQSSRASTASSSTSSSTPAHAPTASVTPMFSSLVHSASSASVRLVLDLLFLDYVHDLVWDSKVLDLQQFSS